MTPLHWILTVNSVMLLGLGFSVHRPPFDVLLMVIPWNRGPTFANQEIEIHTLICLQHVVVKSQYQPRAGGSGNPRSS
jgi:hypothetical protein